jgi:hypothetical protein
LDFGSYQVGSGIGSSSIGSFRVSARIRSGWVGYRVILGFGSYQVRAGRVSDRSMSDYFGLCVVSGQGRSGGFLGSGRVLPPLPRTYI